MFCLFQSSQTKHYILCFVSHKYRSVSLLQNASHEIQTVHCEWRPASGFSRMVCAVAGTEVRYNQLLSDTTVADPPVLSHCVLLCKIPFGEKTGSEINLISIANQDNS